MSSTSLNESLNRFKKQQEKCQKTLVTSTARPTSSHTRTIPKNAVSVRNANYVPAVKFSNDTERLQRINKIRNAPVSSQLKRVIVLLRESREAYTPEIINELIFVDVNANKAVFDSLRKNSVVYYDGKRFSYKSKHAIKNKEQLLVLIRTFDEGKGIPVGDIIDSYPTVMDDLQVLKGDGQIYLLSNSESNSKVDNFIAYPNDPRLIIKVDDDLKKLFRAIELPRDMLDIERDLKKNGMKPATNTAKRRAMENVHVIAQKPKAKAKEKKITSKTRLTNDYLPELFPELFHK